MSSRDTVVFLNTGSISAKCWRRFSGTRMSHSTKPNSVPTQTASRICCCDSSHMTPRRRGNSVSSSCFTAGAFPHLDYLHVPSEVRCMFACFFPKLCHGFSINGVHLFPNTGAAMKETPVELIRRSCLAAPSIHG